jgi:UDP-2-acetamido-3-amino-2,3-dideoxy-glucuronate N-acetyltransferase
MSPEDVSEPWNKSIGETSSWDLDVRSVSVHVLKRVFDSRGDLIVGHFEDEIPFRPKRFFTVFNVPQADIRGEHAHKACHQFLICVNGSVTATVDDGTHSKTVLLNKPNLGIYMPPLTWGIQSQYSKDAVLLVFTSDAYDPADYIRDYDEFLEIVNSKESTAVSN